ncbi:MAG: glutaredoxin domain-containing protein [Dokdonella sp.]
MIARRLPIRVVLLAAMVAVLTACGGVDQSALRAQVGSEPVVLLSTAWCGYCRKLRSDLQNWGVAYTELDVERSEEGQRAYRMVGGRGVPILLIADQVVHGYSPQRARALLGESGIAVTNID